MRPPNVVCAAAALLAAGSVLAQENDRGPGLPTSHSGVYVEKGEVLFDVSYRSISDQGFQYLPDDFGFPSPTGEFEGEHDATAGLLLVAWGIDDRFAVELRATATNETLTRAPEDTSGMPDETKESGLGDVHARLTWRWKTESGKRPELWLFEDVLLPHDAGNALIGTSDLVANTGIGLSRTHGWGTMTYRAGFLFEPGSETQIDFGELAVEYLKRVSPKWSFLAGVSLVEGDEYYATGQVRWDLSPRVALRLLARGGLAEPAVDSTVEAGIVLRF